MRTQILILFVYFSSTLCSITNRIYGGYEVSIEEAPYQVESYYNSCRKCGGSLLTKKFVLSAAHCYSYDNPHMNLKVKVGTTKLYDKSGMTINVEKVYNHPDYDYNRTNNYDYDFALLQLYDVGELPACVQFVRLPSINDVLKDGDDVFITGYGETETDDYSLTLLGTTVKIYNLESCRNNYKDKNIEITTRMICAGYEEGKIDTCQGDSGGPLVRKSDNVLFGVTSFGHLCGLPKYPGVYSRVSSVLGWIYKIINEPELNNFDV